MFLSWHINFLTKSLSFLKSLFFLFLLLIRSVQKHILPFQKLQFLSQLTDSHITRLNLILYLRGLSFSRLFTSYSSFFFEQFCFKLQNLIALICVDLFKMCQHFGDMVLFEVPLKWLTNFLIDILICEELHCRFVKQLQSFGIRLRFLDFSQFKRFGIFLALSNKSCFIFLVSISTTQST